MLEQLLSEKLIQGGAVGIALAALFLVGLLTNYLYKIVTNHSAHDLEERKMLRTTMEHQTGATIEQTKVLQSLACAVRGLKEK